MEDYEVKMVQSFSNNRSVVLFLTDSNETLVFRVGRSESGFNYTDSRVPSQRSNWSEISTYPDQPMEYGSWSLKTGEAKYRAFLWRHKIANLKSRFQIR